MNDVFRNIKLNTLITYLDLSRSNVSKYYFDIIIDMKSNLDDIKDILRLFNCNFFIFGYGSNNIEGIDKLNDTIKDTSYRYSMPLSNFLSSGVDDSPRAIICLEKINK